MLEYVPKCTYSYMSISNTQCVGGSREICDLILENQMNCYIQYFEKYIPISNIETTMIFLCQIVATPSIHSCTTGTIFQLVFYSYFFQLVGISLLLLFSPIFLYGNSFYLTYYAQNLHKVFSLFCSKLSYIASQLQSYLYF